MNHQTAFIRILAVLLSVLLLLGGCSRRASAKPADIQNGFDVPQTEVQTDDAQNPPQTDDETETAPATVSQTESVPAETTAAITETAAPITTAETEAETAALPAYAVVPRMSSRPISEVQAQLDAAGVSYNVVEQYSAKQAAGYVLTASFHGKLDGEFCHIDPAKPVEITVSLGPRTKVNVKAPDPKRIYLTFDDGPHPNTDRVLEILAQYDARATFFTIGMYVAVYPNRAKAIADGGHLLACHSYSHDYLSLYQSAESVLDEIHAWERILTKAGVTVPDTVYFRFPGGSTTYYMERDRYEDIFWAITDAGYLAMDWTCADNDRYLNGKTEDQTLQEYLLASVGATLQSIAWSPTIPKVMLLHDTADETVEALPQILEYLIGEGYTFGTLDELDGYWVFP